jgi:hypothetical protein
VPPTLTPGPTVLQRFGLSRQVESIGLVQMQQALWGRRKDQKSRVQTGHGPEPHRRQIPGTVPFPQTPRQETLQHEELHRRERQTPHRHLQQFFHTARLQEEENCVESRRRCHCLLRHDNQDQVSSEALQPDEDPVGERQERLAQIQEVQDVEERGAAGAESHPPRQRPLHLPRWPLFCEHPDFSAPQTRRIRHLRRDPEARQQTRPRRPHFRRLREQGGHQSDFQQRRPFPRAKTRRRQEETHPKDQATHLHLAVSADGY